ncbi:MAG: NAD(P)/FAD-dependent oxidoreductase [Chloroflexi bacterium]|nr:NAD(P)/FAD-dependent oxidoreductase [Chloroflexota bacterium]
MNYDVAIIGAGMSGLAAGIRLAHFDKKVCILERHHRVGGLNSFYNKDGRQFDVGLHAMTNYVPKGTKSTPLPKLLRQLRLRYEDLDLCQQRMSMVRFPGRTLRFTNDLGFFVGEVSQQFPQQADNLQRLLKHISEYDELSLQAKPLSARQVVNGIISDPILADMIFCPLMYYGNAQEHDMEFAQFAIMFKSIFCEGFARPRNGVRHILDLLVRKYRECGGELRTRSGVRTIGVSGSRAQSLVLEDGEVLTARNVLSSIGYVETMNLLSQRDAPASGLEAGQLSFVESIMVLDRQPSELGLDTTIVFFNNSDRFSYRKPNAPIDTASGVICCPNNFHYDSPLPEGMIRITNMASFDRWNSLSQEEYGAQKKACMKAALEAAVEVVPDFRRNIMSTDMFTPRTIYRYTGHLNGAVYGSPRKIRDGRTHLENLFICGTDQGFLGIVGALLSGISMANLHLLRV